MIYLFAGDDARKYASYEKFLKALPKGMEIFRMDKDTYEPVQLESLYSGSGLFFDKCAVVLKDIADNEGVIENLPKMSGSANTFIFVEGKPKKAALDAFKSAGAEMNVYEAPKKKEEKFNSFILADYFGRKDKLGLWLNYLKAVEEDVAPEEIAGILFWKAKDMILKRNFGKFTENELKNLAARIAALLPKTRNEGRDPEAAMEQFLLEAWP